MAEPYRGVKRIKYTEPNGTEHFEEELASEAQFLKELQQVGASGGGKDAQGRNAPGDAPAAPGAAGGAGTDQGASKPPRPAGPQGNVLKALEMMMAAKQEVDVIVDLVSSVEAATHVGVANVQKPTASLSTELRIRHMYKEDALRMKAKEKEMVYAASLLKKGADMLRSRVEKEDRFYSDLTRLQRAWKVKRPPGAVGITAGGRSRAFCVDVSFSEGQDVGTVDLRRMEDGRVAISLDAKMQQLVSGLSLDPAPPTGHAVAADTPSAPPPEGGDGDVEMAEGEGAEGGGGDAGEGAGGGGGGGGEQEGGEATGAEAAHRLLAQAQRGLLLRDTAESLRREALEAMHSNAYHRLVGEVEALLPGMDPSDRAAPLRALVGQLHAAHYLSPPASGAKRGGGAGAGGRGGAGAGDEGAPVLAYLGAVVRHGARRAALAKALRDQACGLSMARVNWVRMTTPLSSGFALAADPRYRALLTLRGSGAELEGADGGPPGRPTGPLTLDPAMDGPGVLLDAAAGAVLAAVLREARARGLDARLEHRGMERSVRATWPLGGSKRAAGGVGEAGTVWVVSATVDEGARAVRWGAWKGPERGPLASVDWAGCLPRHPLATRLSVLLGR